MLPDSYCKQTVGQHLNAWLEISEVEALLRSLPEWELDVAPVLDEGRNGKYFILLDTLTRVHVKVIPRHGRPTSPALRHQWRGSNFEECRPFFGGIQYSVFELRTVAHAWAENFETISSRFSQLALTVQAQLVKISKP